MAQCQTNEAWTREAHVVTGLIEVVNEIVSQRMQLNQDIRVTSIFRIGVSKACPEPPCRNLHLDQDPCTKLTVQLSKMESASTSELTKMEAASDPSALLLERLSSFAYQPPVTKGSRLRSSPSSSKAPARKRDSPLGSAATEVKLERDSDGLLSALPGQGSLKRSRSWDNAQVRGSPQGSKGGPSSTRTPKKETVSPSPKKQKLKRTYADPSVYAHLQPVEDYLKVGLDIMFCGIK
jgi:hypothetical protein